ncbi:hypothetical protein [Streptomyces sp. NPDC050856]|uniref:hypothetical protein n=1 Tax=Streptomyces sp. NPDC050856 TaxID=3154939 RepID=UPI0033D2D553
MHTSDQTPQNNPTDPATQPAASRLADLRDWWDASWEEGGFLYERWEELRQAPTAGWHDMKNWIKALLALAGMCALIVLLDTAGGIFDAALHRLADTVPATQAGASASSELWGVVDNPVRSYIGQHTVGLGVTGSAVYTFWELAGLFGLVGGFVGNAGARITWVLWGGSSAAMVWAASPVDGRPLATGLAVLIWALASFFALCGLSLRPVIHNYPPAAPVFQPDFRPELHIHATITAPTNPGDDEPDNVHPLQKR